MASSNIIGIPTDDAEFEDRCAVMFASHCRDPGFKRIATRGKGQGGLDLIGTRNLDPDLAIGVQCKLITKGAKLDLAKVESDIRRALAFEPPLAEIYVVTTASDDIRYDSLALTLRQEQKRKQRTVNIQIWGWDTLQAFIRRYPDALRAFDPDYSASTAELLDIAAANLDVARTSTAKLADVESQSAATYVKIAEMHALIVTGDTIDRGEIDRIFDEQVDAFRDLLNSGKPKTALVLLTSFETGLGKSASAAIRSRVRANIGFARLKSGDDAGAATALREALDLNPTDAKAKANSVLADILEGKHGRAFDRAADMLAETPPNPHVATFLYQAASMLAEDRNPDELVPEDLRGDENVSIHRLLYLRQFHTEDWRSTAATLAVAYPESGVVQRFTAEAKLEEAFESEQQPLTSDAGKKRQALLHDSAAALQKHWDEVRAYENASEEVWIGVALNLSNAYRAQRDFDKARVVIDQALHVAPLSDEVLASAAQLDLLFDEADAAMAKLSKIADGPNRTVVLAPTLAELQQWNDVAELLTDERISAIPVPDRPLIDAIRTRSRIELGGNAERAIEALLQRWPSDGRMAMAAADLAYRFLPGGARQYLQGAFRALHDGSRFADRVVFSEYALRHQEFEMVIEALDGYVPIESFSEPLEWLAHAFANSPVRPRTATFLNALGPNVLAHPRIARLAGCAENNRGDLAAAERHLRVSLASEPFDLRTMLILQSVLARANRNTDAKALLVEADENKFEGSPIDGMRLAASLRNFGEGERGLRLGYDVASQNRADERVVSIYPGLIYFNDKLPSDVHRGGTIAVGDWFLLEHAEAGTLSGLLQTGQTPEVTSYDPEEDFGKRLIGKAQGDTVLIRQPFGPETEWILKEVKCRYLWLADDITHSHASRFPDSSSMGVMTMKDGDITPVLDMARANADHARSILESYQTQPLPIEMLALLHRKSPIAIGELIVELGGTLDTCFGSLEERESSMAAVRRAKGKGAVLDTLTAWRALSFGVLETLEHHFGFLAIAQSTIDDLIEMKAGQELNADKEYLTLGFEGEQAVRTIHSPEATTARVETLERAIAELQDHCRVLPVDGLEDLNLSDFSHRHVIEGGLHQIQIAKRDDLFLLSEDFRLRQMNDAFGSGKSGWLQAAAMVFLAKGDLTRGGYAELIGQLAAWKHGHVSLNGQTLLDILTIDEPRADALFDAAAVFIGGARADMASHLAAAADFMVRVWSANIEEWRKGRASGKLIERLIFGRKQDVPAVLNALNRSIAQRMNGITGEAAQNYLRSWIGGHFFWPLFRKRGEKKRKPRQKRAPRR